ncbi:MAG: SGNH/GDSL hydrolase family protein, partial [Fibrobacteria bacterium]
KPALVAFAKRATDHPYAYQVATDAGGTAVAYSLEKAPAGMAISSAGKISWVPLQSQAYDNAVTVKAVSGSSEARQSFNVFVLGLTKAARDALKAKNQAWIARYKAATPGTERPNYHMIMYIGDSQSMASSWGSAILGASTWNDGTFPHYPRFWGNYSSNEPVCQQVSNGNDGQSAMRSSGHAEEYGNLSSQQATFGMKAVRSAVTNTCAIGAATATVAFGHNDAAADKFAATFVVQMGAIVDSLLAFDIIPIVFTVSPGVAGGGWGSADALAQYPRYRDSVVAMCKRRNLPCIDVHSAVQSALNTGAAASLASMYVDAVHYRYDGDATSGNPLHNQSAALNIVNHMLAHMLGYLYESGAHAPVLDTYAAPFYPQGLPKDPDRSPTYLNDYSDGVLELRKGASDAPRPEFGQVRFSGAEILFSRNDRGEAIAKERIYDSAGKSKRQNPALK